MYKNGGYAGDDRMCDLVCDRYAVLQVMSRFGIALGFGDKTIAEVCAESRGGRRDVPRRGEHADELRQRRGAGRRGLGPFADRLSAQLPRLFPGLPASGHPAETDRGGRLRPKRRFVRHHALFFDEYAAEVRRHMSYEEQTVFPYVESRSRARRTRPIRSTSSAASTTRLISSCAS